jgi:hypothetical protein
LFSPKAGALIGPPPQSVLEGLGDRPSAKAGRKLSAATSTMVQRTKIPKIAESLGSVPKVVGQRRWAANRPARANARAAKTNRPASMATAVVAL